MVSYNKVKFLKSKRFLLPIIKTKDLKPISTILSPCNFIIPMIILAIIGQIADDLKTTLNPKDVQQVSSIKFYLKLLSTGKSTVGLSVIYAISKTLGPELETLSILSTKERINFLRLLKKKIILEKGPACMISKPNIISDSFELMKHRKGLALQFRSLLIATPIFSTHSLVLGLTIPQVTIDCIVTSCRFYWRLLGLIDEEFDFLLKKEAFKYYKKYFLQSLFKIPENLIETIKILLYAEIKDLTSFNNHLIFIDDLIVLKGKNNLTTIENELKFIERKIPNLPKPIFISDSSLNDLLIRTAMEQRKSQTLKIDNIFKRVKHYPTNDKLNISILKNIAINKL